MGEGRLNWNERGKKKKKKIEEMGEAPEKARREFPAFPFNPYPIQTDFMAFLYDSLEKGGIAMLESPTGTGKTLSIICSAMQWVVDRRKKQHDQQNGKPGYSKTSRIDEEEPDWMRDFAVPGAEKEVGRRRLGSGLGESEKKASFVRPKKMEKTVEESLENDEETEFLVDDYESEAEDMEFGTERSKRKGGRCLSWSSSDEGEEGEGGMEEEEVTPKIYFTSRTHSQLSQFVREFKRTGFALELNIVCLGSRKNLCTNSGNGCSSLTRILSGTTTITKLFAP